MELLGKANEALHSYVWYICIEGCIITVNASSYTIITAHKEKRYITIKFHITDWENTGWAGAIFAPALDIKVQLMHYYYVEDAINALNC